MKFFLPTLATSLCLVLGAIAAPAQASGFTLDFETDANGNALDALKLDDKTGQNGFSTKAGNIGDIWNSIGIDITVEGSGAPLGLFDSECLANGGTSANGFTRPCNLNGRKGDPDLATGEGSYGKVSYNTTPQGNLLILEENAGDGTPDDTGRGGTIKFNFDLDNILSSVKLDKIGTVDDAKGSILVNFLDGTSYSEKIQLTEENELAFFTVDQTKAIKDFSVTFDGSGGITGIVFAEFQTKQAVPEPATLLGMAAVVGAGLGLKRRVETK